jgi:hypothetical protein
MRSSHHVTTIRWLLSLTTTATFLVHTTTSSADEATRLPAPRADAKVAPVRALTDAELVRERKGAEVERGFGIGIAFTGIAIGVGSTAYTIVGFGTRSGGSGFGAMSALVDGGTGMGVGLALGLMGIPLWVHGQRRVARANEEAQEREKARPRITFAPSFAPLAGGALAGLSATF